MVGRCENGVMGFSSSSLKIDDHQLLKQRPLLILLVLFLLLACSLFSAPIYLYQQFTQLAAYDNVQLVEQSWRSTYSQPLCLFALQQNQRLQASVNESHIWHQLAAEWQAKPGNFFGQHDEAYYRHRVRQGLTIKTSVFASDSVSNPIFYVNNNLVIELPQRVCNPFGVVLR